MYLSIIFLIILSLYLLLVSFGLYYKLINVKCQSEKLLNGKTAVITGSSGGIGFKVALDLARRGARVIVTCPFRDEGMAAANQIAEKTDNKSVVFKFLDLSSLTSVREFAQDIIMNEPRLDLLINNAGVLQPNVMTKDGMNFVMQVNYFGHFLLTILLLPLLSKSGTASEPSRVVNTSSLAHGGGEIDFENMNRAGYYKTAFPCYMNSKLCVTMFTGELARRMNNLNVIVNSADPTVAATKIGRAYKILRPIEYVVADFFPTAKQAAQTTLYLALDDNCRNVSGGYYMNCKLIKTEKNANNKELSRKLWNESARLVKLTEEEIKFLIG